MPFFLNLFSNTSSPSSIITLDNGEVSLDLVETPFMRCLRGLMMSSESSENLDMIVAAPPLGLLVFLSLLFDSIASSMLDHVGQLSISTGGEKGEIEADVGEKGE
jgi:hypothetical protein